MAPSQRRSQCPYGMERHCWGFTSLSLCLFRGDTQLCLILSVRPPELSVASSMKGDIMDELCLPPQMMLKS